jgi:hypothetical protein
VREHAHVGGSDDLLDGIVGGLGDDMLEVDVRAGRSTDDHPRPHARRERHAGRRSLHHHHRGRELPDHLTHHGVVEPVIDRREDGTELRRREQGLEERRMVGAKPADTVPAPDAEPAEPMREAAHPVRELTVSAAHLAMDQRGVIGRDPCPSLDPRADAPIRHHLEASHTAKRPNHRADRPASARDCPRKPGQGRAQNDKSILDLTSARTGRESVSVR